jgi:hypothetical protein
MGVQSFDILGAVDRLLRNPEFVQPLDRLIPIWRIDVDGDLARRTNCASARVGRRVYGLPMKLGWRLLPILQEFLVRKLGNNLGTISAENQAKRGTTVQVTPRQSNEIANRA